VKLAVAFQNSGSQPHKPISISTAETQAGYRAGSSAVIVRREIECKKTRIDCSHNLNTGFGALLPFCKNVTGSGTEKIYVHECAGQSGQL